MNETRPCLVEVEEKKYTDGIGRDVTVQKKAKFHRWANDKTYANDVEIPYTNGIVEFQDGTVKQVDPTRIKFTD
jgi:hypothetical protein